MKKYEEIANLIEDRIQNKEYKIGSKLPSIRVLVKEFDVNKSTIIKAYELLIQKHVIYSIPKSGYFIVETPLIRRKKREDLIDFSTGTPDIDTLPNEDFKHCLNRAIDIYGTVALHHDIEGMESLRRLLASNLQSSQIFTSYKNIFINLGVQQALTLLTNMPFPNNKDIILVENPTYKMYVSLLKNQNSNLMTINRTEDGIDLNELEYLFKNHPIKFFYTIPRHHNPFGTTLNTKARKKIAKLAEKYDVYIVEDDYLGEMDQDSKYDPIISYGNPKYHIYLNSYSKTIPWIRIGYSIIPDHLIKTFKDYKWDNYYYSYVAASIVAQATLEIYIKNHMIDKHIINLKRQNKKRIKALEDAINGCEFLDDCKWIYGTGYYSYLKIPDYINEDKLILSLEKRGVLVQSGALSYLTDEYPKGIRICIARTGSKQILTGIKIIESEVNKVINTYHNR
jgi:DNA-binding transcriptional MocR family regulator